MARQHIIDLRKLRKLSQGALAKAAGLTSSEISRIECGYRDLSEAEAVAIAKALEVIPGKIEERLLKPVISQGMAVSGVGVEPKPVVQSKSLEDDPANFRELPDESILERGKLAEPEFRLKLGEALKRANQVLHTPKVPAATWRAWREFERKVQARLREQ
jgi:transcriptional regulator with XRE-family HTH domain